MRKKTLRYLSMVMIGILTLGTVLYPLQNTPIAIANTLYCNLEEHQHDEKCSSEEIVCNIEEHVHKDECSYIQLEANPIQQEMTSLEIKAPDTIPEGITLNVRAKFYFEYETHNAPIGDWSGSKHDYKITSKDQQSIEKKDVTFTFEDSSPAKGGHTITGIKAGDTIQILNIPTYKLEWEGSEQIEKSVTTIVEASYSNGNKIFEQTILLNKDETQNKVQIEETAIPTNNTSLDVKISEEIADKVPLDVRIKFYVYFEDSNAPIKDNGNSEHSYEIISKNENGQPTETKGTAIFEFKESNTGVGGYTFKGIKPGDVIRVSEIPKTVESRGEIKDVTTIIEATDSNGIKTFSKTFLVDSENEKNEIVIETDSNANKLPTEENFVSKIGDYTLKTVLSKYNIFSFNDIEATHVVGPIVAQNKAYYTTKLNQNDEVTNKLEGSNETKPEEGILKASDYSNGTSSYVGKVEKRDDGVEAKFSLNYGFDKKIDDKDRPTLYVSLKDNFIEKKIKDNEDYYEFTVPKNIKFAGPNSNGKSKVLQNDNFINFEEAKTEILNQSHLMTLKGDNINVCVYDEQVCKSHTDQSECSGYKIDYKTGYLEIDAGKNYIIEDATRLRFVNIKYPDGFAPKSENQDAIYPHDTVINISDNELVKSGQNFEEIIINGKTFGNKLYPQIDGQDHYYLPIMLVDGTPFNGGGGTGEGIEYGDHGGLIWNMSNVNNPSSETSNQYRVARLHDSDILGHIISPYSEIWSYEQGTDGSIKWLGGNMNGCAIVKSWHGGYIESHMWPYNEEYTENFKGELQIKAQKKLDDNTNLGEHEFEFELSAKDNPTEGLLNPQLPVTVIANKDTGIIEFPKLTFTQQGDYTFYIKEVIKGDDNIEYDDTIYTLDVKVSPKSDSTGFDISYTIKKNDSEENAIEIVFNNKTIKSEEETLGFNIEKVDSLDGNLFLPGAKFNLYLAKNDGKPDYNNLLIENITTDDNGKIYVENNELKIDTLYVLVETEAPEGYIKGENIVFYIKGTDGLFPDINDKIVIGDKGTITVENKKGDEVLPEAGGTGTNIYIISGMFMIITSASILKSRRKI